MAIHPNRTIVATGQVASSLDGSYEDPFLCVWDTRDVLGIITRITFPSEGGVSARYIVAMGFSGDGKRLVVVTGDNRHTVYVYHWRSKHLIYSNVGHNGQPPQVYGVAWNNFQKGHTKDREVVIRPGMFVTYGLKHIKIWTLDLKPDGKEIYNTKMGRFGSAQVGDVLSACFVGVESLVTGTRSGDLLLWDMGGRRAGSFGSVLKVIPAHAPGPKAPSIHDGQLVVQGVRALCLRAKNSELVSGGSDGTLIVWDITNGTLGRVLKTIPFHELSESSVCSFRSLDAQNDGYTLVVGTNRCEIWALSNDIPESLVQGHTNDVYACAWHPKKPYKFATACDSSNVFLWNARRRQLIAKVNVGLAARSVAFSPNGAHLAVGTITGSIRVVQVEDMSQKVAEMHFSSQGIKELKYSPDGTKLAAGSHDCDIDIFDVTRGYARLARCTGHSSYINHVDWSVDSRIIQSTCGAYELLYFDASTGKQVRQNQRDTMWHTWTVTQGFPVMGIWRPDNDGTDINSACRTHKNPAWQTLDPLAGSLEEYVLTAGDDGRVRIFNYPCVVENAPGREYIAHCSHVMDVRVAPTNRWAVSVGGSDRSAMQWRILPESQDEVIQIKPQVEQYKVFTAAKRKGVAADPLALMADPADAAAAAAAQITADADAAAANALKNKEAEDALRRQSLKKYEVTTVTSNIKGAGTDAQVFVVLTGSKGKSMDMKLENSPDNFERGRTDAFMLEIPDLGDVHTVMVGHNGKGSKPRWHLEKLIVLNKTDPGVNPAVFTCGQWMGADVGDGQLSRILKLGTQALTSRKYKVLVKTSDIKGAGTDANVFLTLFGEFNGLITKTKPMKLENSTNNFERGQNDVFEVEGAIGNLRHIYIGHDNTNLEADWHLQEVLITSPGMPDKQFVANRWLSTKEGDGATYCNLYPTGAVSSEGPHKYKITVYTSDIRGAGTDARVYITFFNDKGMASRKFNLDSSANNFERGMVDVFFVTYPDLGGVAEIEIEHDNSGLKAGWHCEQVVVEDETAQTRAAFPCDRWLATDEDDGKIRRRLKARAASSDITSYRVTVMTSDIKGAGTDANVSISLCGERDGKEVWGPSQKLDGSKNNFERSQVDTFLLKKQKSLGELKKIKIGHDNHGAGPGWHLDHVEVWDDATGQRYFFPCQRWLDKTEEDGLIERVLDVADINADADTAMYKITVHTSDIKFAGTDANVFIQIFGNKDGQPISTPKVQLNNSKNNFERGMIDEFTHTMRNVKDMQRIVIGHDNSQAGADWHLKMVEVFNVMTTEKCSFFYNGWLAKSEPPYQLEVELFPTGEEAPPVCRYGVSVYTSDIRGAGTDANVHCVIYGEKGQTPRTKLETTKNNFERGQRDDFVIESIDLGQITKLEIGHDDSGPGSGWHLSHVEVRSQATQETYFFNADQWLEKANGTLTLTLLPSNAAGAHQIYQVRVRTGDVRGAGTDADVSIILIGSKGQSQEIQLESSADNFERNKLDEFKLDLGSQDLGDLQKVDIGFSAKQTVSGIFGGLTGKKWNLTSVEVIHFNTQTRTFFFEDDWLSEQRRRVLIQPGKVGENNVYRVIVRTSDIKGAGTDANVTLNIVGEKDGKVIHTGPQKLDSSANDFERGHVDTFIIKSKDVGELKRVMVTSDGSGIGGSWHLNQVEVTDTVRGETQYFPCNEWLDPAEPMSLNKTLLPRDAEGTIGQLLQYEVIVFTSDVRGAGTDANVEMELWGTKDHTSPHRLDTSANNFERGQKDMFAIKAPDIGDLTHVIVRKDNSGLLGTDWHLQSVEVLHPLTKKRFFMLHNDWLKGACERKLEVGKVPASGKCTYRVTVTTSDTRGAGTDANVKMQLFGEKGNTGERKLDSSANDFERGKVDTFFVEAVDVGYMHKLTMSHDNSGFGSSWHLAKVEVVNMVTGERAVFPYNNWLDKEHGLSVDLTPDRTGDGKGDGYFGQNLTEHTITVYTSDVRGAGTDADVFIELYGDKGVIGQTRLDTAANNFERNQKDVFKIKGSSLGDVQKVVIKHNNAGMSPDWHLRQVEVFSEDTQKTFVFPCNDWLKKEGADDSKLSRELVAGSPDQKGPTNYCITVHTSDLKGAGTDADVHVVVYGELGDTGERLLDNSKQNNFERGKVDTFFVTAPNMGPMKALKVKSSNTGLGAAWHLAKVEVSSSATGEKLVFPFHNWFSNENGTEHVLWPDRDGDGTGDVGELGSLVKYRVSTYTADERGAGTDANVTIALHGTKGFVGATRLENAQNNFERGRKDEFEIMGTDVGELTHVDIAHDNSLLGSAWKLDQVEVFHPKLQRLFIFPCHDWLQVTDAEGLDGCKKTLREGALAAADSGTASYKVLVQTSDIRGAGTDSDIFICLFGPKGDSGERLLDSSANDFERGKLDTFMFSGPDVGEVQRIKIRSSNTGLGSSWHLSHVDVFSSSMPEMFHFPFNNWVDSKHGLEQYIWRDGTEDVNAAALVEYRVTVYTSDIRGAGTDANVSIEMFGSKGAVGLTRLETSADNFERNHADMFVVRGTDIGDVEHVVISHDNSGVGPSWHCQQVDVFNPSTQRTYTFPCNAWLEKTKEKGMDGCRKELVFGMQEGQELCDYKVEVHTGDVRGAGTDSNVEMCVFGTKGDTGMHVLANSRNNFERNKEDVFFFKAPDIGMMTDCRVVSDGSGIGSDWFLDDVVVTNTTFGTSTRFPYNNWFDSSNGWAHNLAPEGMEGDSTNIVKYQVTVITSDIRGAGTDGEVFMALKGEHGAMGETRLESGRKNFERNQTDVFEVTGSAIGALKEANIRLVPKGLGSNWHLKMVEVINLKSGAKAVFVYDDWLEGGKEGDPKASVTLLEASTPEARAKRKTDQWRVTTVTGTQSGAGTDADVFIQIWGPNGMLGGSEIYLEDSKNNFEKGSIDTFVLDFPVEKDCGDPIEKLVVERGKTFMCGANWNLDMIEVLDVSRGHTYKWACGKWFNDKEGLKKEWHRDRMGQQPQDLELVEAPAGVNPVQGTDSVKGDMYRLQIKTSDKLGAGTDASVRVELTDASGHKWKPYFAQESSMFERGATDEIMASSLEPMDEMVSAHVFLENCGIMDGWHLETLHVTQLPSQRKWEFRHNGWVPKDGGVTLKAEVVNDVPLNGNPLEDYRADVQQLQDQDQVQAQGPQQARRPAPKPVPEPIDYEVVVHTENKLGAGTDASVTAEIVGSLFTAQHTFGQARSMFERGSVDRFKLRLPDCGDLQSLRLWHEGAGVGKAQERCNPRSCSVADDKWLVSKVTVEALPYGSRYEAKFDQWLKGGKSKVIEAPLQLQEGSQPPSQTPAGAANAAAILQAREDHELRQAGGDEGSEPEVLDEEAWNSLPQFQAQDQDVSKPKQAVDQDKQPQVLEPEARKMLPQSQKDKKDQGPPDQQRTQVQTAALPEPTCEWKAFTAPYEQDPEYDVTWYYNEAKQISSWEKPPEYAAWEEQHKLWRARYGQASL
uniref:PLAT domain-containing protein n=1 Tax=Dunaliella tertiolecta TaxID=3047 RepID=A0A7S3VHN2_DUNTE